MGINRKLGFLTFFAPQVASVILIVVIIIVFYGVAPAVETRLAPVYSKFQAVLLEPVGGSSVRVQFRFQKKRPCAPYPGGWSWYVGDIGTSFRQVETSTESPTPRTASRPLGWQLSEVFIMNVSMEQFNHSVFGETFSDCHALWPTRSIIFP